MIPSPKRKFFSMAKFPTLLPTFNHTHSLTGKEFKAYKSPIVYAWKRDNEWLYIGRSQYGLNRIMDGKHNVFSREEILDTDLILLMYNLPHYQACALESRLIKEHKPRYNKQRLHVDRTK